MSKITAGNFHEKNIFCYTKLKRWRHAYDWLPQSKIIGQDSRDAKEIYKSRLRLRDNCVCLWLETVRIKST